MKRKQDAIRNVEARYEERINTSKELVRETKEERVR
jgi:hypothetical protein